jgi:hypothetical protein
MPAANRLPSRLPLRIIAPRTGIDTQSPFARTYPGIPWRVRLSIQGGKWPDRARFYNAPGAATLTETLNFSTFNTTGLRLQSYLWIEIPSPVVGTYPFEVIVEDQDGSATSVSWTLTVTTTGFLFCRASGGSDSNPGTEAQPKQTMLGVDGATKADNSFDGRFVYYYSGEYAHDVLPLDGTSSGRATWQSQKAHAHIGLPGETAVMNMANRHWNIEGGNDWFLYNLSFTNFGRHVLLYLAMFVVFLPVVIAASHTESFRHTYPFYRMANRSQFDLWAWQALYAAQFLSLEFFFRGFMLHGLRRVMGANAIFVMIVPYCMIHYGKPMPETLGAIGAGLILGTLAMRTKSIWGGVLIHVGVAVTMDVLALRGCPPMGSGKYCH